MKLPITKSCFCDVERQNTGPTHASNLNEILNKVQESHQILLSFVYCHYFHFWKLQNRIVLQIYTLKLFEHWLTCGAIVDTLVIAQMCVEPKVKKFEGHKCFKMPSFVPLSNLVQWQCCDICWSVEMNRVTQWLMRADVATPIVCWRTGSWCIKLFQRESREPPVLSSVPYWMYFLLVCTHFHI